MRKALFAFVLATAFGASMAAAQSPIPAPLNADQIYFKAVDRLHTLPDPPYMDFKVRMLGHVMRWDGGSLIHGIVRSSDGMEFMQELAANGAVKMSVGNGKANYDIDASDFAPDFLLRMQQDADARKPARTSILGLAPMVLPTAAPDHEPGEIGSVRAIYNSQYRVSLIGVEQLAGCPGDAYHLKLDPRRDANEKNVLRDLWISTKTFDICRLHAGIIATEGVFHAPVNALVEFGAVGPYWLATHVTGGGTSRFLLLSTSANMDVTFTDLTLPKTEPAWLFDKTMYAAHMGLPAPASSPSPSIPAAAKTPHRR